MGANDEPNGPLHPADVLYVMVSGANVRRGDVPAATVESLLADGFVILGPDESLIPTPAANEYLTRISRESVRDNASYLRSVTHGLCTIPKRFEDGT